MSTDDTALNQSETDTLVLPSRYVIPPLLLIAVGIALFLPPWTGTPWLMALELGFTILGLFVFGSFRYRIHKNALTFGMLAVISATFFTWWWPRSSVGLNWASDGVLAFIPLIQRWLFSWHGLERLVHADTMLFIAGLTLLVAIISESRLLEAITFRLLSAHKGRVLPTVLMITGLVALSSGILDGVSMIGLLIRTLTILLLLVNADLALRRYAVMVCTVITTVCGMWLAYGEPPNLIMKANVLDAQGAILLTDRFFLEWCLPLAVASFAVVAWNLRSRLTGMVIDPSSVDVLEKHSATFRFLQAERHGEVLGPVKLLEKHKNTLGDAYTPLLAHLKSGKSLGESMVRCQVDETLRRALLGVLTTEEIAARLDEYFILWVEQGENADKALSPAVTDLIALEEKRRLQAQHFAWGGLAAFGVLLVLHSVTHAVPLFVAPLAGSAVAVLGILPYSRIWRLALHNARDEFSDYYFLFPLFASITLLTRTGFFNSLQGALVSAISSMGVQAVAILQFLGCTFLSAILDNNVVADFAARALHSLPLALVYLFSMSQMAGYALGGCWTHIGSAQSVLAFRFIREEVDPHYVPVMWIKEITPLLLQLVVVLGGMILLMGWLRGVG